MARRVPIWKRGEVWYYTDAAGKRISLRTKERTKAIERYENRPGAKATARGVVEPEKIEHTPPSPARPLQGPERPPTPDAAPPISTPDGAASDPLRFVGETAGAPPPSAEPVTPDAVTAPSPGEPSEAEVKELAEMLAGGAQLLTGMMCQSDGINPGQVPEALQNAQVARAMPLARRLAMMPIVRSWYVELAAFAFVTMLAADAQRRNGTPIDPTAHQPSENA
jgi:hypothetical protein